MLKMCNMNMKKTSIVLITTNNKVIALKIIIYTYKHLKAF